MFLCTPPLSPLFSPLSLGIPLHPSPLPLILPSPLFVVYRCINVSEDQRQRGQVRLSPLVDHPTECVLRRIEPYLTNTLPDLESISDSETDSDPAPSMSDIQDEDGNIPLFNMDGEFTEFLVLPSCPTKNPDFYDTVETNNCVYSTVQDRYNYDRVLYSSPEEAAAAQTLYKFFLRYTRYFTYPAQAPSPSARTGLTVTHHT